MEKSIFMIDCLWCHHLVIMADFLMPETEQSIIHVFTCVYMFFPFLLFNGSRMGNVFQLVFIVSIN